jgi:hypothetical protein
MSVAATGLAAIASASTVMAETVGPVAVLSSRLARPLDPIAQSEVPTAKSWAHYEFGTL